MDLKLFRTFIQVAEAGTLTKASDQLRIAQPALSRHIKLLEREIGLELFNRSPRGMQLTSAGKELLERISGLVRQIDQSIIDLRLSASQITGQVILGVMASASGVLPGRIVRRTASELPGISLRIIEGSSSRLGEWLQRGEIDISMLYEASAGKNVHAIPLISENFLLIGPSGAALRSDKPVNFMRLPDYDLVMTRSTRGVRSIVDKEAAKAKLALRIRFEVDSFVVLKDLVAHGFGYTILPGSALSSHERQKIFTTAPLTEPQMVRQIALAYSSLRPLTFATRAVADLIIDENTRYTRELSSEITSMEHIR